MKRRCKSAAEFAVMMGSSGTVGNWGHHNSLAKRKTKRVRFTDAEMNDGADYGSMRGRKTAQAPSSDAPKTSEFAYFTNVKNGIRCHSDPFDNKNVRLKSSKTVIIGIENIDPSEMFQPRTKNLRYTVSGEMEGPSNDHFPLSPMAPNQGSIKDLRNHNVERLSFPSQNAPPVGQSLSFSVLRDTSENSGSSGKRCNERGIFSATRQRLRQLAHSSNSEVENFHPEGAGLISSLTSRLYGKGNDSLNRETVSSFKSPTSCESENLKEGYNLSHTENWIREFPKVCSASPIDREYSEEDTYFSGFHFPNHVTEINFQDEVMDFHHSSSGISCTKHGLPFSFSFERFGSSGSTHPTEPSDFCFPIEYAREVPCSFLLEWAPEGGKGALSSSMDNHDLSKILSPEVATTCNVNCQQMVDEVLNAEELCSPSWLTKYHLEYSSPLKHFSTSFFPPESEPNFNKAQDAVSITNRLTFPCTPKCRTLTEEKNAENVLGGSDIILSYRNQNWLKNKLWNLKPRGIFLPKCLQSSDFCQEGPPSILYSWEFPLIDNSLYPFLGLEEATRESLTTSSEGTIHYHLCSLDRRNLPLLLDNVSYDDEPKHELLLDDDNKLNYDWSIPGPIN